MKMNEYGEPDTPTYRERTHICYRCGRVGRRHFAYVAPFAAWVCESTSACSRRAAKRASG